MALIGINIILHLISTCKYTIFLKWVNSLPIVLTLRKLPHQARQKNPKHNSSSVTFIFWMLNFLVWHSFVWWMGHRIKWPRPMPGVHQGVKVMAKAQVLTTFCIYQVLMLCRFGFCYKPSEWSLLQHYNYTQLISASKESNYIVANWPSSERIRL
jgi:hypothetical protein